MLRGNYNTTYGEVNTPNTITNNDKFVFQNGHKVGEEDNETDITADADVTLAFVRSLSLSGTGYVQVGEGDGATYYTNDGTPIIDPATKAVVTFDLNGGTGTIPPQGIYDGGKATKPADPTAPIGYSFDGWYEKVNDTFKDTAFDFANTAITANITLYAKWTHVAHSGGTATCRAKAICDTCGVPYGEFDSSNHSNLKHIEAKAATTEADGNIEYWHCEDCNRYFSDKDCKNEILPDSILLTKVPQTGEHNQLPICAVLLFVSGVALIGTAAYSQKKKAFVK